MSFLVLYPAYCYYNTSKELEAFRVIFIASKWKTAAQAKLSKTGSAYPLEILGETSPALTGMKHLVQELPNAVDRILSEVQIHKLSRLRNKGQAVIGIAQFVSGEVCNFQ